ncbi:hypothetical protein Anas_05089, partial [Armadillidium nasatum]
AENNTEINGNQISTNNNSYELITDEIVRNGLQKDKGKNAELLSWEVKDFTKKGDGYTSNVTSVTVKYRKDETQSIVSYVLKLNPQRPPGPMSDLMDGIFIREKEILTSVLEAMSKHLERINLSPIRTPRLFASSLEDGKEAILLENLRTQGFQMHDGKKGHDYRHSLLVMEELGRFHASSLLLEESIAPKTFEEAFQNFVEPWFNVNSKSMRVMEAIMVSQAIGSIKYLEALPGYEKCVKWLKANQQNLGRIYIEGFQTSKSFKVLSHGDCHTNNMLFKYNNSLNMPVDMRFVDLQCTRWGSPASDIIYYTYSSLTGKFRSEHFQNLLCAYYHSFSKVLIFSGRKVPFTFRDLEDEIEKRKIFGLVIGLMALTFVLCQDEDDVVDLGEMTDENRDEFVEKQRKQFMKLSKNNKDFDDRFLFIFDEMLESHFFDEI